MNLELRFQYTGKEANDLKILLETDTESEKNVRSTKTLKLQKDTLTINIKAADATAMRAAINTILKVVNTYEKAKEVTK